MGHQISCYEACGLIETTGDLWEPKVFPGSLVLWRPRLRGPLRMVLCRPVNVNGDGLARPQESGHDAAWPTLSVEVRIPPIAELQVTWWGGGRPLQEGEWPSVFLVSFITGALC